MTEAFWIGQWLREDKSVPYKWVKVFSVDSSQVKYRHDIVWHFNTINNAEMLPIVDKNTTTRILRQFVLETIRKYIFKWKIKMVMNQQFVIVWYCCYHYLKNNSFHIIKNSMFKNLGLQMLQFFLRRKVYRNLYDGILVSVWYKN